MFDQTKAHKHVASAVSDRESPMAQLAAVNYSHALLRAVDAATFLKVCASPRKLGWVIEKERKGHERAISMHRQLTLPALSTLIFDKKHVNGRHGLRAKAKTRSNRPLHPRRDGLIPKPPALRQELHGNVGGRIGLVPFFGGGGAEILKVSVLVCLLSPVENTFENMCREVVQPHCAA